MSRRGGRPRPPRLPDPLPRGDAASRGGPTTRAALIEARIAGPHPMFGRAEVARAIARLTAGAPDARLGLDLGTVARDEVSDALARGWGWSADRARAFIDPDRTLAGFRDALARLRAVGSRHGRVAAATGRPASLLPLVRALAGVAVDNGAELLGCARYGPARPRARSLWWQDGVAVATDGRALLGDDGVAAGPEWLFATGRPDLVVADHGFAAAAIAAGIETVALADLDAGALGVAAGRGLSVRLVPLADCCPPAAYAPLLELLHGPAAPGAPGHADRAPEPGDSDATTHFPHSTTRAPAAYAHPEFGGEG